jgi:molybdopterin-biosynthesis enzyme MoeA-like protein
MEDNMALGLIIIGDEILSGKRQDKHFQRVREILAQRGLQLAWTFYLGDDRARLTECLAHSFASGDVVFSCGGIGATPDDHTRQAAAAALGRPLAAHPEAQRLIAERTAEVGLQLSPGRLAMGEFPEGATLIPNPVNRIPGFAIRGHWFVPGFPEMAWPMIEWVLDTHYSHLFHAEVVSERGMIVRGLAEGSLTPLLEQIERDYPGVRTFSLPHLNIQAPGQYEIDLGVKGKSGLLDTPFDALRAGVLALGGTIG